uniref:Uncharacterized protein n=1 Tax=Arundo donax TaxID=35708 RepID=A0A0A9A6R3_ARUDO
MRTRRWGEEFSADLVGEGNRSK